MNLTLVFLLLAVTAWIYLRAKRSEKIIDELHSALKGRKRLLLEESSSNIAYRGLVELIKDANALIDDISVTDSQSSGLSKQVEVTLNAIQEAVFILNEQHEIEYSNGSAEQIFNLGDSMKTLRLEAIIRSPNLLGLLADHERNKNSNMEQISIELGGEILWFEASCSKISRAKGAQQTENATLLVLHDITRLKQLEMIRTDFVANVSHELRTPLTIIKGFSETLVDDHETLSDEVKYRFLGKIRNNTERLHLLVEDLLTLSRLESQPDQLEMATHSLEKLLMEVQESYNPRLSNEQTIEIIYDAKIEPFGFDMHRIHQVLDNIFENVFRYATGFTKILIDVRLTEAGDYVECKVSDNGLGIPEKSLPHLFERFYRVDKGRSQEKGGTGLGLSILKHIILLHGGTVRAESRLGEGTSIFFTIPYQKTVVEESYVD